MSEVRLLNPAELRFVAFEEEDDNEGCLTTFHIVRKLYPDGQTTKPACGADGTLKYRFKFYFFLWRTPLICEKCRIATKQAMQGDED